MTLSQYLGRGATSRGRATINSAMVMDVGTTPYLHNQYDISAVIQGITNILNVLKSVSGLTVLQPPPGTSVTDFVNSVCPLSSKVLYSITFRANDVLVLHDPLRSPRQPLDRHQQNGHGRRATSELGYPGQLGGRHQHQSLRHR